MGKKLFTVTLNNLWKLFIEGNGTERFMKKIKIKEFLRQLQASSVNFFFFFFWWDPACAVSR